MRQPTPEQMAVLADDARVRLVRACPGSGKTWLVSELIRREVAACSSKSHGVAALSFTRVAGQEIRSALQREVSHPHFVGTIDAFLFRYVLRPFLLKVFPGLRPPSLVPAEWGPGQWHRNLPEVDLKITIHRGRRPVEVPILETAFVGEESGAPQLRYHPSSWDGPLQLTVEEGRRVLGEKKKLWKRYGWVTHSDGAFLASHVLGHAAHGQTVKHEIWARFPFLVIDELQDTGFYLGKCIRSLLLEPEGRAVLVGDPDQAIFEFNGARPDLFESFLGVDGTREWPLGQSLRCSPHVARAASALSATRRTFQGVAGARGRARLIAYDEIEGALERIEASYRGGDARVCVRLIARSSRTVEMLAQRRVRLLGSIGSPALNHLHRATTLFRAGRSAAALAASKAFLGKALFDSDGLTENEVVERGIGPTDWKRLAADLLLESDREVEAETIGQWRERIARVLGLRIQSLLPEGARATVSIRNPSARFRVRLRSDFLCSRGPVDGVGVSRTANTVHSVKGETHDVTVLVVPAPRRNSRCPSETWWAADRVSQEEGRIAFVAATRSRGDFVVLAASEVVARLRERRPDFCARFDLIRDEELEGAAVQPSAIGGAA